MVRHYPDNAAPVFIPQPKFMSDTALSEFLSARPCLNADVIFYNRERATVYLPTRQSKPAEGLWVIGGAIKAGELPTATLLRRIKAETGLMIAPERLEYLGTFSFFWSYRKETPTHDGRHDYNFVYALAVTDDELRQAAMKLDPVEYDATRELTTFNSIEALEAAQARPCLIDYYRLIFPQEARDALAEVLD